MLCQGQRGMKLIKAIIKPFKLEDVRVALEAREVHGLTVTDGQGMGRQKGHVEIYRGSEYLVGLLPKTIIEVVAPADRVPAIVSTIVETASTGRIGDGKVFVLPVEQVIRIRTGDTDRAAL